MRDTISKQFVTTLHEVKEVQDKIEAYSLIECSAKENVNLKDVFETVVRAIEKEPIRQDAPQREPVKKAVVEDGIARKTSIIQKNDLLDAKPLKITIVGDMAGKSSLLIQFVHKSFPGEFVPTVFGECG